MITLKTIIEVLDFKYDEDETVQLQKQNLIDCFLRVNHRSLMQEYLEKLGGANKANIEAESKYFEPVFDTKRTNMTIQSKTAFFNKLSKNALQNVMEYFDYKGTDFIQMRCINRKTKNAYMQHLQNKFNAERYFQSLEAIYLEKNKETVNEFKQSCKVLKWEYSLDVQPRVPSL